MAQTASCPECGLGTRAPSSLTHSIPLPKPLAKCPFRWAPRDLRRPNIRLQPTAAGAIMSRRG
jgi:hypothetical protein